jgi:hypothetical protein
MSAKRRIGIAGAALGFALALAGTLGVGAARAADPAIEIGGAVATPLSVTEADLKALPATDVAVTFHTGHGDEAGKFTGALLWAVLEKAGLADHQGNHPDIRHAIAVTGSDGYVVILGFGEIDPDFAGKPIIIAYARDGQPTDAKDRLRLIVPGDAHGGRDVRDVTKIEVR